MGVQVTWLKVVKALKAYVTTAISLDTSKKIAHRVYLATNVRQLNTWQETVTRKRIKAIEEVEEVEEEVEEEEEAEIEEKPGLVINAMKLGTLPEIVHQIKKGETMEQKGPVVIEVVITVEKSDIFQGTAHRKERKGLGEMIGSAISAKRLDI